MLMHGHVMARFSDARYIIPCKSIELHEALLIRTHTLYQPLHGLNATDLTASEGPTGEDMERGGLVRKQKKVSHQGVLTSKDTRRTPARTHSPESTQQEQSGYGNKTSQKKVLTCKECETHQCQLTVMAVVLRRGGKVRGKRGDGVLSHRGVLKEETASGVLKLSLHVMAHAFFFLSPASVEPISLCT